MLDNPFDIVYIDPPWDYKGQKQHAGAGAGNTGGAITHYPTVTLPRMKEFPIAGLMAPSSLLFMWVTNPHLAQGIDLIRSWGLQYATVAFVWDKQRVNPGFYTMSQCELCLVAKKGKIPTPRGARNIRQFVSEKRGRHSAKPSQVRERITKMFPSQRKLEIFARHSESGWSSWGFESGETTCPLTANYLASCGWGVDDA